MGEFILEIIAELIDLLFGKAIDDFFGVFIPKKKLSPKAIKVWGVVVSIFTAIVLASALIGVYLLFALGASFVLGWILLAVGIVYISLAVVARLIIRKKK